MQHPHVLLTVLVVLTSLGVSSVSAAETPPVERLVINRIVAVVDGDAITLLELKRRVEPFLKRLADVPPDKRSVVEAQVNRDVLQQIIEERLIAREARAARVFVAAAEIETAIDNVAAAKKVTRAGLVELVQQQGFSEALYREQLVRQLLTAKLVRIRMAEKLRNLDKDPDKAVKQVDAVERAFLLGLRADVYIEVRL